MRFAIAYYPKNTAGNNIVKQFNELAFCPQIPIIKLKKETIFSNNLNEKIYPELKSIDVLIFASTHKSAKGNPSLCIHAPGNWRKAELGGEDSKICPTSAFILKYLFQNLNKNYQENKTNLKTDYEITLEVTHHGPYIHIPCIFIELGSTENEWDDQEAAKIIAKTILSLQKYNPEITKNWIPVIGIGGPHYAPNFNKIQLSSNYAISHIIPQYSLPLTEQMLIQAEEKTKEQIKTILVDWKGCKNSEQREQITEQIKKSGLNFKKTKDVEK